MIPEKPFGDNHDLSPLEFLARGWGLPCVDLESNEISDAILRRHPARVSIRERCVPMLDNPRRTVLVVDDASRIPVLELRRDEFGIPRGKPLEFALTSSEGLTETLLRRLEIPDL